MLNVVIQTIGGLGLFILGMKMMTEGLQMSAGDKIKKILGAVSSNRVLGCATGAGVTAIVQSSSATTVMLISFVGAGYDEPSTGSECHPWREYRNHGYGADDCLQTDQKPPSRPLPSV